MLYRGLLLLHLVGVVTFFANAVAALFWKARASGSGDRVVIAYTLRTFDEGDRWITPIAVVVASGVALSRLAGLPLLGTGWILWSIVALLLSGLVFVARVAPPQRRLALWTGESARLGQWLDRDRFERESRRWSLWAHLSLGMAGIALVLMVAKPMLPAP